MKLLLLANPTAAGGRARRLLPSVLDLIRRQSPSVESVETSTPEAVAAAAREAARAGYERVIVAGGDGTVNVVLNAVRGSRTALGVLPLGHGNDLARSLGLPLDPRAAAELLVRNPPTTMDVGRVGDRIFATVAAVGLDAETNRRARSWGSWPRGHLRYFLAGLRTLATYQPYRINLVTDSEEFIGEAMWVAVANAPCYGGGIRIAPEALLDDGLLDVCVIERMSAAALLALYPALMRGEHLRARSVRYFRCARAQFRAPAGVELHADGEPVAHVPAEIVMEPAAVHVIRGGSRRN
ncbi:MAG: diacylglycerol/lipid kinase family protein [Candidatus Acidiferrales bacterium]